MGIILEIGNEKENKKVVENKFFLPHVFRDITFCSVYIVGEKLPSSHSLNVLILLSVQIDLLNFFVFPYEYVPMYFLLIVKSNIVFAICRIVI